MNQITFGVFKMECHFVPQILGHGTISQHTSNTDVPITGQYIYFISLVGIILLHTKIIQHISCFIIYTTHIALLWKHHWLQKQFSPQLTLTHKFPFTVCCLFTCVYWSCSYHDKKAELNIKTSNTQSTGNRPKQLLGEVQYNGAKTVEKKTQTFRLKETNHKQKPQL